MELNALMNPQGLQPAWRFAMRRRIGNHRAARIMPRHGVIALIGDQDACRAASDMDLAEIMFMSAGGYISPEAETQCA